MSSLPFHLEPITTTQYVITGDVVVGEGVAIAPGVLLQADPGSRIVLGMGVCLGMGCVIHASGGEISIGRGSNLGAGVLVVGVTTIGERALVGAGTTVMGQTIAAGALVAPSSLLVSEPQNTEVSQPENVQVNQPENGQVNHDRVNVETNGYFYAKGNGKVKLDVAIEDPWASNVTSDATPEVTFKDTPSEPSNHLTPIDTEAPVVSTFVYPDDNLQPKHAWQTSAQADLGNPNPIASPNPVAATNPSIPPPQPNPDSDLSAEEMQQGPEDLKHAAGSQSSELAPREPKQVYGQAYVNQMLGKMLGKKD
jgi:carbonic anhydrase/acetyltransferase-like protein (isoleucine patch superfamily)